MRHGRGATFRVNRVEVLRALGYVDTAERTPKNAKLGVLFDDPSAEAPGLTYYTSVSTCSSHIIDHTGKILKTWSHQPCWRWGNSVLLPNGHVLAVHMDHLRTRTAEQDRDVRALIELDQNNAVVWERRLPVHHDVEVTPSGNIATLTYRHRVIPQFDPHIPVRDHYITLLSRDGKLIEQASLTDILLASKDTFTIQNVRPRAMDGMREIDLVHSNTIEFMHQPWLAARSPLYRAGNLLICIRNQDSVAIINWQTKRVVWSWGRGILSGPHDATVLPNGHILVFDNGVSRGWSRALEMDPLTDEIVWRWSAPDRNDFYSRVRGSVQRLANGDTLIADSQHAVIFEVSPHGEVVWKYRNQDLTPKRRKPTAIVRAHRYVPRPGTLWPTTPTD